MQTVQGNTLQSLRAVEEFLEANAAALGDVVNTGTRQKLGEAIAALEVHVTEQAGSNMASQGATQKHYALRRALIRDHMAPIARMVEAGMPPVAEVEALRFPDKAWPLEKLAAAAHGMAKEAAPFAEAFIKAGLRPDFVERLTGAADAMVNAVSDRVQNRGKWSGATKGMKTTLAGARKLVKVIDALVASALVDDPALLANWKRVKRVRKVAAHPADTPTPPVAIPPNANVPTAALPALPKAGSTSDA